MPLHRLSDECEEVPIRSPRRQSKAPGHRPQHTHDYPAPRRAERHSPSSPKRNIGGARDSRTPLSACPCTACPTSAKNSPSEVQDVKAKRPVTGRSTRTTTPHRAGLNDTHLRLQSETSAGQEIAALPYRHAPAPPVRRVRRTPHQKSKTSKQSARSPAAAH